MQRLEPYDVSYSQHNEMEWYLEMMAIKQECTKEGQKLEPQWKAYAKKVIYQMIGKRIACIPYNFESLTPNEVDALCM